MYQYWPVGLTVLATITMHGFIDITPFTEEAEGCSGLDAEVLGPLQPYTVYTNQSKCANLHIQVIV